MEHTHSERFQVDRRLLRESDKTIIVFSMIGDYRVEEDEITLKDYTCVINCTGIIL